MLTFMYDASLILPAIITFDKPSSTNLSHGISVPIFHLIDTLSWPVDVSN